MTKNVSEQKNAQSQKGNQTDKTAETAVNVQKASIMETIEKFKPLPPTAEERILRIEHFEVLSRRYSQLKEKANDLKMFEAGNDKTNAKIIFENSQGFEFEIRNSSVIDKLKKTASEELKILLDEAQNEVLTFEI